MEIGDLTRCRTEVIERILCIDTAPAVPDVSSLGLREAVRSLHTAGFRVQLTRSPSVHAAQTAPAAGELARTGSVIRLLYDY